tara:strand:+ start:398 stop:562 length:165 start_codon:yes stop_codon:yes gene_type:complete
MAELGGFLFILLIAKLAIVTTANKKFHLTEVEMPPYAQRNGGTSADHIQNETDK